MTWHEEELLRVLADLVRLGQASIIEDPSMVLTELFQHFPSGSPIVDWERVPNTHSRQIADPSKTRRRRDSGDALLSFWRELGPGATSNGRTNAWVIFDGLVDYAVRIDAEALERHLVEILDCVPAAVLIFSCTFEWAMTYTFDDYATFGVAPSLGDTAPPTRTAG
jgi:hypothetical protein